jgi:DNA-binding MarR family transcriptional regulator
MERWGYVRIQRPRTDSATWVLTLTQAGRRAAEIFARLPAQVDERWERRFPETAALREVLAEAVAGLDPALPDCLPVTGPANAFLTPPPAGPAPHPARDSRVMSLGSLLARVLFAYTVEAERGTRAGLPFREDLLRLIDDRGTQVRDLPRRSGVSKEAQAMALGILERAKLGEVGEDPQGSRFKVVRLTPPGSRAREAHVARLREVDVAWAARAPALREVLTALVAGGRLREGLEPPPGSWRATVPPPETLPAYPMVLHRGGYPDGS